jgi:hypothetical protein
MCINDFVWSYPNSQPLQAAITGSIFMVSPSR